MKIFLLSILLSIFSSTLFAQHPTFKLNYKILVDESLFSMDENDMDEMQKTIATTAALALAFQDENEPIAEVWVNKNFVRAKAKLSSEEYELIDKENKSKYTIYPSAKQYNLNDYAGEKILEANNEEYALASELPIELVENQEKEIAGYKCKLAKISFGNIDDQNVEIHIWYTEAIPQAYWGEYGYLKNIPGAALEITTNGFGITVSKVDLEDDISIFEIPKDYTQIEMPTYSELSWGSDSLDITSYEIGNNLYAFYDEESGSYGIKDSVKNTIVEPQYTSIQAYVNGFSVVTNSDYLSGTIDLKGNVIIPLEFESLYFSEEDNSFTFSKERKYGILDHTGKVIIPNQYDNISFLKNEYAIVTIDNKYGLVDKNNKIIVNPNYEYISEHSKSHFIVYEDDKAMYILYAIKDEKPKASYEYIVSGQADDLYLVISNTKYGFINGEGKVVIPIKYDYASIFESGKSEVKMEGIEEMFYINTKGEEIK